MRTHALLLAAILTMPLACGRHDSADGAHQTESAATPAASGTAIQDAGSEALGHPDAFAASRCSLATKDVPPGLGFGAGAELGESVSLAGEGEFAVGALRMADGGRLASVIRVGGALPGQVDLGDSWGDAPPPQPFVRGESVYAVGYVRSRAARASSEHRALSVHGLEGARSRRLLDLAAETDVSPAYDVVAAPEGSAIGAVVAWDDLPASAPAAQTGPSNGIIRLASLAPDLTLRAVRVIQATVESSVPTSASDPRLAARPNGYWLTWVARRPERPVASVARAAPAAAAPAGEIETPSEEPSYGWVEAIELDAAATPVGAPRRLTAVTGHVGGYAIAAAPTDKSGALVVVAEDDGASGARGGGKLEQVFVRGSGERGERGELEVTQLVRSGVEEDAPPTLVSMSPTDLWLLFPSAGTSPAGDVAALPLEVPRGPVALLPSLERALARSRVLGSIAAGGARHGNYLGAASLEGGAWMLHWVTCTR